MTFHAAVVLYAAYRAASYFIRRRHGYSGAMPVGSALLGLWAAYLLVLG
jgi:hypothetical protein